MHNQPIVPLRRIVSVIVSAVLEEILLNCFLLSTTAITLLSIKGVALALLFSLLL